MVIALLMAIWLPLSLSFRLVFGSIFVIFLPGFFYTFIFFEKDKQPTLPRLERVLLSLVFSITLVPLVVFYLNKMGLAINLLNTSLVIVGLIVIAIVIIILKNKKQGEENA